MPERGEYNVCPAHARTHADTYAHAEGAAQAHRRTGKAELVFWLALYIAAMFCIALPVALFSRNEVAGIVFAVWGVGQVTYQLGFPEPGTQVFIYAAGLIVACRVARSAVCLFAAILFFPLGLASFSHAVGWIEPAAAWWSIYWVAMTQAVSLPFCIDWQRARDRLFAGADHKDNNMLRVRHA